MLVTVGDSDLFCCVLVIVQFSPLADWVVGGQEGQYSRDHLPVVVVVVVSFFVFAGGRCEQFWHGQGCQLYAVVHQIFPLPITTSPTLQGSLKDGFGEAVLACNMPEPCKFPSLYSCLKRFLLTHKEDDLAPHPVVDLVLQVGDAEMFVMHLVWNVWILFFHSQQAGSLFHSHRGVLGLCLGYF